MCRSCSSHAYWLQGWPWIPYPGAMQALCGAIATLAAPGEGEACPSVGCAGAWPCVSRLSSANLHAIPPFLLSQLKTPILAEPSCYLTQSVESPYGAVLSLLILRLRLRKAVSCCACRIQDEPGSQCHVLSAQDAVLGLQKGLCCLGILQLACGALKGLLQAGAPLHQRRCKLTVIVLSCTEFPASVEFQRSGCCSQTAGGLLLPGHPPAGAWRSAGPFQGWRTSQPALLQARRRFALLHKIASQLHILNA